MEGIPHERSLVEKYKGRPFVMLGINFGENNGNVAAMEKKFNVTWRSFASDKDNYAPDLVDDLEMSAAGMMMLIDDRGIIRYKGDEASFLERLDYEVEALVQEAENRQKENSSQK